MIPILYKAKETDFTHNGIGSLAETISCTVTESRNGAFELSLVYPLSGRLFDYIQEDCIIKAKPNDTSAPQLFRIYKSSKPMNGRVSFYAEHISYLLSGIPIESVDIKSASAATAISKVLAAGILEHKFTAQSDIETLNSTSLALVSVRAALGGVEGSILDTYGGEYEFDNFTVKLHAHRGKDTGIKIAYGKNLTDFKQEKSISEVYSAVYPYAKYTPETEDGSEAEEITVTLSEKTIYSPYADNYGHVRILMKDFTDAFEDGEEITEAKLRSKAQSWVDTSGFDVPSVNITVTFKNLWKSPEYAKYALLERVSLCDTVIVVFEKLGVTASAKIIKTVYDVLKEQYNSIELGDARSNFADTINQNTSAVDNVKREIKEQSTAAGINLTRAIEKATAAITGQSGGHVVLNPANNPQEILFLDKPDISSAVNLWRWNLGGLGFSHNGYNGAFETAITSDGHIVANFIDVGELDGAIIKANSIKADALSVEYKQSVTDEISKSAEQTAQLFTAADNELLSEISKTYATGEKVESAIKQLEGSIDLKVSTNELIAQINLAEGVITLNSNRLTVSSTNFELTEDGSVTAANVNLSGSMKTTDDDGDYYTHIHDGVIEQYLTNKRISYFAPVGNAAYTQLGIVADNNYSGIMIGEETSAGVTLYYSCNIESAYTFEKCRHHFVGTVNFDNAVTVGDSITIEGNASFNDKVLTDIEFNNGYGLVWNGNICLRYATTTNGVVRNGVWLGSDSYNTCINGSGIYLYGDPRITGELRFLNVSTNTYTAAMWYDWSNDGLDVGTSAHKLYLNGSNIYANGSPISTSSDERKKNSIRLLDNRYLQLIRSITPISFRYNADVSNSGRTHTGFGAGNVLDKMTENGISTNDFAAFVDLDGDGAEYALRYEEFVPLLLLYTQTLEKRIETLEKEAV